LSQFFHDENLKNSELKFNPNNTNLKKIKNAQNTIRSITKSIGDIIKLFKTLKEVKYQKQYQKSHLKIRLRVGKSFQFFYLYRLATENIGTNVYGNIPDTVIRQVGANSFSIYDFEI
jgi:hypothetical protein